MSGLKSSVSATFVFAGQPIEVLVGQARAAHFDALEFQVIDRALALRLAEPIADAGRAVALINLDTGDLATGGPGLSAIPDRRGRFAEALAQGVEIARILKPAVVHVGPSRFPTGADRAPYLAQLRENLARARDALAPYGCRVSIEPLNATDFPDLVIESGDRAIELIERVGEGTVLQYDLYHAAMDGRGILADLKAFGPYIGHVQIADCPGRAEPGTGRIDFRAAFAVLRAQRYAGYVGAEYRPSRAGDFGWMTLLSETG